MAAELNGERLLTVTEVAEQLQVHHHTVRRHIKAGKLRAVRVGRNVRILKADLETYLRPESEEHARLEREKSQRLLNEARRLLKQLRIELPQRWLPARQEMEAQNGSTDESHEQTNGERIDVGATEVVGQHRRAFEQYKRVSGGNGRRF